jgi:DNA repair exonuclease SbcCD ATPase subunit
MEGPLKELAKLERLTDNASAKGKSPSISDSLDSLLQSLRDVKDRLEVGTETQDTFSQLAMTVDAKKKEVKDKEQEIYSSLARLGKALDKVRSECVQSATRVDTG